MFRTSALKLVTPIIIASMLMMIFGVHAQAAAPSNFVSYQGRVLNANGVPVSDASVTMKFFLYDALTSGTCLWSNSSADCDSDTPASTTGRSVTLTTGLFTQTLGDTGDSFAAISDSVFGDNSSVFLEVDIAGETLTPRRQMTAAPYAINAQRLDGIDSTGFLSATGDTGTGDYDLSGAELLGASPLVFEGGSNDGNTTTFAFTDPTTARTITFQNGTGTVAFTSDISGTGLLEDGTNGVYEDDEAVIVGIDAAFTYGSGGVGDLRVTDELEVLGDGFIDNDLVVGASTSSTETLANTSFAIGGDDLFVAGTVGVEGSIYTDGGFVASTDTTYSSGAITTTGSTDLALTIAGGDLTFAQATVIGDGGDVLSIDSSDWDISTTGDMTGIGAITMNGNFIQSGATSFDTGTGAIGINGLSTFATDADFTYAGTENISITNTTAGADVLSLSITSAESDAERIALTLANDADADSLSALAIAVTSASTSDADIIQGIHIEALSSADGTVTENAIVIGSGWDSNLFFADTSTTIDIADTGVFTFRDSTNTLMTLTDSGTTGDLAITGDIAVNGDDITSDGNLSVSATGYVRIGDSGTPEVASTDDDLYVESILEVDGETELDGTLDADGAADFSGGVTISSSEFLLSGGNFQLNDNINLTLGTGDDLTLVHDGTDTTATSITGDLVVDNTDTDDQTIFRLGTDTAATGIEFRNNSDAARWSMTGAGVIDVAGTAGAVVWDITAGDATLTDGSFGITDADNANTFTVVNNTATTAGAGGGDGVINLESTSLTTGGLLNLELTEANLTTGNYIQAYDVTATAIVFEVAEDGNVTIAGSGEGNTALAITSGDIVMDNGDFLMNGGDFDVSLATGDGASFGHTEAPTVDMFTIENNAFDSVTDGVDLLVLDMDIADNTSGDILHIIPSFVDDDANGAGGDAWNIINIEQFTATLAADGAATLTNSLQAVNIGNLTESVGGDESITSTGFTVGTGWDAGLSFSDTTATVRVVDTASLTIQDDSENSIITFQDVSTSSDHTLITDSDTAFAFDSNADTDVDITTVSNEDLVIQAAGTGDVVFDIDEQSAVEITASSEPGVNMLRISNTGFAATSGVSAIDITHALSNSGGSIIKVTPEYTGGASDGLAYKGFSFAPFAPANAAGTDTISAFAAGNLTDPGATITSRALFIGTGWDREIEFSLSENFTQPTNGILRLNGQGGANDTDIQFNTDNADGPIISSNADTSVQIDELVIVDLASGGAGPAVCHTGGDADTDDVTLEDCSGAPTADYAEQYPAASDVEYGHVVVPGTIEVTTNDEGHGDQVIRQVVLSSEAYQGPVVGIVSNNYGDFTSAGYNIDEDDNPMPVALVGRVPVKVTNEGGLISVGDYLTTSSTPGYAMKANNVGRVIGMALNDWDGSEDTVMVQVNNSWYAGQVIDSDGSATIISDDVVIAQMDDATSSDTAIDSYGLALRGSAWNGSEAEVVEMVMTTAVDDTDEYRLSINNTSGTEVAYVTNEGTMRIAGDMVIAGKLYPSDRGVEQTSRYIYYDGDTSAAGDYMRTNAKGWSTGSYDFAEMFPSDQELKPGDVVMFSGTGEEVRRSDATATTLAGIVSTRPGFLAGKNEKGAYPIALAGRVPTSISLLNGAIAVGDPLTSSDESGVAMKATEAGSIIGYALEAYDGNGDDKILVYVNVGYWGGEATSATPGTSNVASSFNSGSTKNYSKLSMSGEIAMNSHSITNIGSLSGMGDGWAIESNGTIKTQELIKTVIDSYQNKKVETVAVTSPEVIITLSGTSTLENGSAEVRFEQVAPDFNDVIDATQPIRVVVTPSGPVSLYVSEKDQNHFNVKRFAGSGDVEFDWMVTAYRRGYAAAVIEEEVEEEVEVDDGTEEEELIEEEEEEVVEEEEEAEEIVETDATEEVVEETVEEVVDEIIEEEVIEVVEEEVVEGEVEQIETETVETEEEPASLESPELIEEDTTSDDEGGALAEEPSELVVE